MTSSISLEEEHVYEHLTEVREDWKVVDSRGGGRLSGRCYSACIHATRLPEGDSRFHVSSARAYSFRYAYTRARRFLRYLGVPSCVEVLIHFILAHGAL